MVAMPVKNSQVEIFIILGDMAKKPQKWLKNDVQMLILRFWETGTDLDTRTLDSPENLVKSSKNMSRPKYGRHGATVRKKTVFLIFAVIWEIIWVN